VYPSSYQLSAVSYQANTIAAASSVYMEAILVRDTWEFHPGKLHHERERFVSRNPRNLFLLMCGALRLTPFLLKAKR